MERWGLSPRVSTPSCGQCHMRQRYLRQWRADGDLADQPTDAPCTTDARTTRPYSRRAQRQCRPSSHLRGVMTIYRPKTGWFPWGYNVLRQGAENWVMSRLQKKAEQAGRAPFL